MNVDKAEERRGSLRDTRGRINRTDGSEGEGKVRRREVC